MANVDVYNHNKRVGRLQKQNIAHHYGYELTAKHALSLTMPIRVETYSFDGLHPFFQMNMPEGGYVKQLKKQLLSNMGVMI
ncbi:HipA N-terminal domain-containing protein [Psychromonas sp. KJ10-10]|uniref:HipA N-terminal domain-containing protein n=1 Tax=Psychromonas sp. KJ10-10 TaxID=3391823 RepID=UPI0039B6BE5F